jgi:hypothetical protein
MSNLETEVHMIEVNINRMCETEDFRELEEMFKLAKLRLQMIFNLNHKRINEIKQYS